jgi:hypothetical protein
MYIVDHPELLDSTKVIVANALKRAGLVSFSTSPVDLQPSRLFDEARDIINARRAMA